MAENFVVSARKYRPITFDTVVGQSHITTTLKNAVASNHLAQAFLFCGPRGVGKTTTARILAKTINCQNLGQEVEACGSCDNCVAFQNNASFNVHELDAASNNSVDDIRNLIDQVRYPPQSGKYKIYIIDEVHMLSTAAFNAFLKTLEEPPSYAIFILATTEKHKILPTILSRCQIFDFNRILVRDMAEHLAKIANKEGVKYESEALELIAQKADGGLRDALSMFDLNVTFSKDNTLHYAEVVNNLHILDYDYYFKITNELMHGDLAQGLLTLDEILRKGFDGHLFLVGLLEHFRNVLVCKDPATIQLLEVSETAKNKYLEQATKAELSFLLSGLSIGNQVDINYKASKNQRLHLETFLVKLAHLKNVFVPNPTPSQPTIPPVSTEPSPVYQKTVAAPVLPPTSSKLRTTINLSPVKAENSQKKSEEVEAFQKVNESISQKSEEVNKSFSFEQLREHWNDFIEMRQRSGGAMSEKVMLDRDIKLEDGIIKLNLDNLLQETLLNDVKYELLGYLRRNLKNQTIQIAHTLNQESRRSLYSPYERFNLMVEKNPSLKNLQQALGLEVDF